MSADTKSKPVGRFSGEDKRTVRELLGWPKRYLQADSSLEAALREIEKKGTK